MNIKYYEGHNSTNNLEEWIKENDKDLTIKQVVSLYQIRRKWYGMAVPWNDSINGCIMVNVIGQNGFGSMTLGIEKDGYTHS